MSNKTAEIIRLVKSDVNPALGCTEPVAVAFAAAVAKKHMRSGINHVEVIVSKNIYKNGKSVYIPHTDGSMGLELAAACGLTGGNADLDYMVLRDLSHEQLEEAKDLIKSGKLELSYADKSPTVYVKIKVQSGDDLIESVVEDSHTGLHKLTVNGETIFKEEKNDAEADPSKEFFKGIGLKDLREMADAIPDEELAFIEEGIEMNMLAAKAGLNEDQGLGLGKRLRTLSQAGLLSNDAVSRARILTAAAADMRMGGGDCPIMTSGGSGNQGLGVIIPITVTAEENNIADEKRDRAIFFGHAVNKFVKIFSGKLSGMCGCAIGAGIGAAAGIAYMLGGDDEVIAGACNNLFANLTGIICDGAKDTCSLKLSSCAGESVLAAYLALKGMIVNPNIGIVGSSIEETIGNIGRLSLEAFPQVDAVVLDIIDKA